MRLAQFIDDSRQLIVDESVRYAGEIPALSGQALETLRDHLPLVLEAIARDLERPQTRAQSITKSEGRGPKLAGESAAETHGLLRARSGLDIEELVAEYRVLRSCVLRLWSEAGKPGPDTLADTMRFNEAIDQAVAESVAFFNREQQRWRSIFLAVLGHDLRGPLNAMLLTAEVLTALAQDEDSRQTAQSLLRNGRHMEALLNTLLDYSRSELGVGMGLHRSRADVSALCREEVDLLRAALPGTRIDFGAAGDTMAFVDAARVREALANLVSTQPSMATPTSPSVFTWQQSAKWSK